MPWRDSSPQIIFVFDRTIVLISDFTLTWDEFPNLLAAKKTVKYAEFLLEFVANVLVAWVLVSFAHLSPVVNEPILLYLDELSAEFGEKPASWRRQLGYHLKPDTDLTGTLDSKLFDHWIKWRVFLDFGETSPKFRP